MCTTARGLPCPGQDNARGSSLPTLSARLPTPAPPSPHPWHADPDPCEFTYIWTRREYWCDYCTYYLCASEDACLEAAKQLGAAMLG
jgi:hypothetical protein